MRILMVNKFAYVTGGADRHCLELAQALRAAGHTVAFLSTSSEKNVESAGAFVPLRVTHKTRDELSATTKARVLAEAFWNRRAARAQRELIERFRPDVVHIHKLHPQLSIAPAAVAGRRVPVVQTLHDYELIAASPLDDAGSPIDRHEPRLSYRALNSLTYPVRRLGQTRLVDRFVAVSRFAAGLYAKRGIDATVIPNFVEDPGVPAPPFEDRQGMFFAGNLAEGKGVADVVELARRLTQIPVTIAGAGDLEGLVRAAAEELPNLSYPGWISPREIPERMRRARVAVLPSRVEAGGLGGLEAMAAGTPVATYNYGGLAEYVSDAGGGRVLPNDVDALAGGCGELHEDRESWTAFSRQAVAGVEERHSVGGYVKRIEGLYAEAAGSAHSL